MNTKVLVGLDEKEMVQEDGEVFFISTRGPLSLLILTNRLPRGKFHLLLRVSKYSCVRRQQSQHCMCFASFPRKLTHRWKQICGRFAILQRVLDEKSLHTR